MKILSNYPLYKETSFGCGGKARYYTEIENLQEFENLLKLHKGKYYILGNGTKTLCVDNGFDNLVISTKNLNKIEILNNYVVCECGVNFFQLGIFLAEHNLSGFENLYGIPASVGGATIMNAGAFNKEFSEFIEKVEIFENGSRKILDKTEIEFGYRYSSLKGKNIFKVYLGGFEYAPREEILALQEFFLNKRKLSQPYNYKSAGSIFKRDENTIPAKIIDKLGLKGVKIGGAEISSVHSGFIINTGNATATDIIELINLVKSKVKNELNILLENELIILE